MQNINFKISCSSSLNSLHVISERLIATGDDEGCVKVIKYVMVPKIVLFSV